MSRDANTNPVVTELPVFQLDEDELDALQELYNMSIGAASAIVAEMMDVFVNMQVPHIEIIQLQELQPYLDRTVAGNKDYFLSSQSFRGDFYGESLFFVDRQSANNLAAHLEGDDALEDDSLVIDVFMELSNIVCSGFLKTLGSLIDAKIPTLSPSFEMRNGHSLVDFSQTSHNSQIIVSDMMIDIQTANLKGSFMILAREESLLNLKLAIDEFVKKYS